MPTKRKDWVSVLLDSGQSPPPFLERITSVQTELVQAEVDSLIKLNQLWSELRQATGGQIWTALIVPPRINMRRMDIFQWIYRLRASLEEMLSKSPPERLAEYMTQMSTEIALFLAIKDQA